jgi:hypothetical protein
MEEQAQWQHKLVLVVQAPQPHRVEQLPCSIGDIMVAQAEVGLLQVRLQLKAETYNLLLLQVRCLPHSDMLAETPLPQVP